MTAAGETHAKVELFLVVDGRRWRVYDWAEISGAKYPRHHGQHAIEFRGFVCQETGEKRVYRFKGEKEDRGLDTDSLVRQLEEAGRVT